MLAFALCIALFLFWWVVGYSIVKSLHATRCPLQDMLMAAPVGVVATVIPIWTFNRLGVPVGRFGAVVGGVLLVAALALLWRLWKRGPGDDRHPGVPWRLVWPFAGVLAIALAATARPMFAFGFDWVSYCNDDMANYCLGADRFYRHGFFDFPDEDTLIKGTYWPNAYWFMHVMTRQRPGSELLVSWAMSVTGRSAHEVFMPVIVALNVGLVASATGLLLSPAGLRRRRWGRGTDATDEHPVADSTTAVNSGHGDNSPVIEGNYLVAWVAGVMIALSALSTLGLMYQLIAQVLGLSLVAAVATIVLRPFDGLSRSSLVRHGAFVGVMGAGVLIIYPECVPFLGLSFLIYAGIALVTRRMRLAPLAIVIGVSLVVTTLLLRTYTLQGVSFMLSQSQAAKGDSAGGGVARTLFPYFMVPKGLADLWGLLQLGGWKSKGWVLDLGILGGGLLTLFTVVAAVLLTLRGRPEATITLVMFGLAFVLFRGRIGFGLFKLAMYLQPFMLATVALAWFALMAWMVRRLSRGRAPVWIAFSLGAAPLLFLAFVGLRAQSRYVMSSYGVGTSFLEIPNASSTRINDEFRTLLAAHEGTPVVSDTFNIVLAKFQALYTRGRELVFPSNRFTRNIEDLEALWKAEGRLSREDFVRVKNYQDTRDAGIPTGAFDMMDPARPDLENGFLINDRHYGVTRRVGNAAPSSAPASVPSSVSSSPLSPSSSPAVAATAGIGAGGGRSPLLVVSTGAQSVFNRWHYPPQGRGNFSAMPLDQAQNILVFVTSDLGQPYFFSGLQGQPAIYQIEEEPNDSPFFRGATMCGIGRYLMAQVINPTPQARLAMTITLSYHSDGINQLPPNLAVIGSKRLPFPVVGRGSARLFSPPVDPQIIDGRSYLMYDLGTTGRQFPAERTGLMNLFGTDVPIDRRILSGFARDVSLISEEQYASMRPPAILSDFAPDDTNPLRNPQLEYSGFYEDGWVGEDAYARLTAPPGASRVSVSGQVPQIGANAGHSVRAILSVDGVVVAEATVTPGNFELSGVTPDAAPASSAAADDRLPTPTTLPRPADAAGAARTVRLQFIGPIQSLNAPDNRPAAALLKSIGFEAAAVAKR